METKERWIFTRDWCQISKGIPCFFFYISLFLEIVLEISDIVFTVKVAERIYHESADR